MSTNNQREVLEGTSGGSGGASEVLAAFVSDMVNTGQGRQFYRSLSWIFGGSAGDTIEHYEGGIATEDFGINAENDEGDGVEEDQPVERFTDADGTEWVISGDTRFAQYENGMTTFRNDDAQEFSYLFDSADGSTEITIGRDIDQNPIILRQTPDGANEIVTQYLIFTLSETDRAITGFRANEQAGYRLVEQEDGSISIVDSSGAVAFTLPPDAALTSAEDAMGGGNESEIPIEGLGNFPIEAGDVTYTVSDGTLEVVQGDETYTVEMLDETLANENQADVQITMDDGNPDTHEQSIFIELSSMVLSMDDVTVSRFFSVLHFAGDVVVETPALDEFLAKLEEHAQRDAQDQATSAAARALALAQSAIALLRSGLFNSSNFSALACAFSELWGVMQHCSGLGVPVPNEAYCAFNSVAGIYGQAAMVDDQLTDLRHHNLNNEQAQNVVATGNYFNYVNGSGYRV